MTTAIQTLKRNAYAAAAFVLLASTILPTFLMTSTVSAAELVNRSIDMSTSAPSATDVEYTITFTGVSDTEVEAIIVDFCTTPLIGTSCTAPSGFSAATPAIAGTPSTGGTWTASALNSDRTLELVSGTPAALNGGEFEIRVGSIATNPSTEGTFYARILTYAADTNGSHTATSVGSPLDQGTVAMSTAEQIDVTARVNESMTFCVSGTAIADGCADPTEPNLTLGDGNNGLLTDTVSAATAYFQLSTNAASGAAIKLRNSAASGGLNSGSNSIAPVDSASPANITGAGFGVRVPESSSADEGVAVLGSSAYGSDAADEYNMRHPEATNAYGDTIASAAGPTSNANVPLVFGAQASNITPAGIYTAVIVLIATSTY